MTNTLEATRTRRRLAPAAAPLPATLREVCLIGDPSRRYRHADEAKAPPLPPLSQRVR